MRLFPLLTLIITFALINHNHEYDDMQVLKVLLANHQTLGSQRPLIFKQVGGGHFKKGKWASSIDPEGSGASGS